MFPVLTGVFGWRVRQGASSILAISPELARSCLSSDDPWVLHVGEHGFCPWILIYAIVHDLKIGEPLDRERYPEPDYEDLGRARILHIIDVPLHARQGSQARMGARAPTARRRTTCRSWRFRWKVRARL